LSENLDEKKKQYLGDEQLDEAAGGGWGWHTYNDESQYNAAGIRTNWTFLNPFSRDDFYWTPPGSNKEEKIDKGAAANIVFYQHCTGHLPKSVGEANKYKVANIELFDKKIFFRQQEEIERL